MLSSYRVLALQIGNFPIQNTGIQLNLFRLEVNRPLVSWNVCKSSLRIHSFSKCTVWVQWVATFIAAVDCFVLPCALRDGEDLDLSLCVDRLC